MRGNGSGAIIQMSSLAAVDVLAGNGAYAASKFAVEGMSVALAREMECFNVHVVILEPGPIKTGIDRNSRHSKPIATYEDMLASDRWRWVDGDDSNDTGDPAKCAEIVLTGGIDFGDTRVVPDKPAFNRKSFSFTEFKASTEWLFTNDYSRYLYFNNGHEYCSIWYKDHAGLTDDEIDSTL